MAPRTWARMLASAAAAVMLPACASDQQYAASSAGSSAATPTPTAALPYVVVRHQVDTGLLTLQHAEGDLWASRPGGVTRIDLPSGTPTALPDLGQLSDAYGLAVGGAHLWVTDFERTSMARIRIADLRVDQLRVLKNSEHAAYGFGSVWVSNHRSSSVQRLDPATGEVVATVTIGTGDARCCGPSSSVAAFGRVWVSVPFVRGVVAIDPSTNRVAQTVLIEDGGCSICGDLAATGEDTPTPDDDGIWAVGDTGLHRIDPHGAALSRSVPLEFPDNSGSEGELAATPDGVFVSATRGRLLLVDQTTTAVEKEIVLHPSARNVQLELAYGDGRLWAYERFSGSLSGIDPALVRTSDG